MPHITFSYDPISPYAYLAFEQLPVALQGLSVSVSYRPVLFAGLLKHHGQLGPAEIAPKRDWTYRQVLWLAQAHGIPMALPASHPFNPLGLLRLAVAAGADGLTNRYVTEMVLRHVWRGGHEGADAARLQTLAEQLAPAQDPASESVKNQLKANTQAAIDEGLFGVPAMAVDDKVFWGFDALPMLRAYLENHPWFAQNHWQAAHDLPTGVQRSRPA